MTIQIRHVPDDLHRRLKSQAALQGMSLSAYLLREIEQIANRLYRRLRINSTLTAEDAVRAIRGEIPSD